MSPSCWTTKLCTIFVSARWNWLPQLTVTWTIWCLRQWAVWPAACASLDSWTATCARLQWTWCRSHVCTSSWQASHHWLLAVRSSIVHWQCQSWRSRCWVVEYLAFCVGFRWFPYLSTPLFLFAHSHIYVGIYVCIYIYVYIYIYID